MIEYLFTFFAILVSIYIVFFHKKSSKEEEEETIVVTSTPTLKVPEKETKPAEAANDSKFPITILYGSQSGTAEDLSAILKKEALRRNFRVKVCDLETYNRDDLEKEKMVIFLVATYGEGEPTDNSREFHDWLSNGDLPDNVFENVNYTVFGLGNTTYEHYNRMGRSFDKLLKKYGAHTVYARGEGDDNGCLEDDFNNWKAGLWTGIAEFFVLEDLLQEARNAPFVRDTKVILYDPSFELPEKTSTSSEVDLKNPRLSKISEIRELHTEKSDRSCLHIEFDLADKMTYEPGDHLGVYPENQPSLVARLASRLGVDLDQKFSLVSTESETKTVVGPCTVRHAFSSLCDITSLPRKNVLKVLAENTDNPADKEFLFQLASGSSRDQGPNSYESWIKKDLRNIVEVLEDLPSVKISFDLLVEILPRLSARYYSISSSLKLNPGKVSATAVLVNYTKPTGKVHDGVCTTWFKQKQTGTSELTAPIFLRKSTFRLPANPKFPIIMVGPGTGLAPFRGFIQERKYQMQTASPETTFGESLLFFGCRTRDQDYIYQDELEKAVEEKVLSHLFVAFSRETQEKVYVQHKLKENGALIWNLIDSKNAYLYVCGDGHQMAKDVQEALTSIAIEHGKLGKQQSEDYVHSLQSVGRYLQDVWY